MQDALTLAFDITAVAAVAYLSTEFCLGLAERATHPKPTPVPSLDPVPMAAIPATTASEVVVPVATVPSTPAPTAPTPAAPIPGAVQPLPNLSAVPKPEPEYLPLKPKPVQPKQLED